MAASPVAWAGAARSAASRSIVRRRCVASEFCRGLSMLATDQPTEPFYSPAIAAASKKGIPVTCAGGNVEAWSGAGVVNAEQELRGRARAGRFAHDTLLRQLRTAGGAGQLDPVEWRRLREGLAEAATQLRPAEMATVLEGLAALRNVEPAYLTPTLQPLAHLSQYMSGPQLVSSIEALSFMFTPHAASSGSSSELILARASELSDLVRRCVHELDQNELMRLLWALRKLGCMSVAVLHVVAESLPRASTLSTSEIEALFEVLRAVTEDLGYVDAVASVGTSNHVANHGTHEDALGGVGATVDGGACDTVAFEASSIVASSTGASAAGAASRMPQTEATARALVSRGLRGTLVDARGALRLRLRDLSKLEIVHLLIASNALERAVDSLTASAEKETRTPNTSHLGELLCEAGLPWLGPGGGAAASAGHDAARAEASAAFHRLMLGSLATTAHEAAEALETLQPAACAELAATLADVARRDLVGVRCSARRSESGRSMSISTSPLPPYVARLLAPLAERLLEVVEFLRTEELLIVLEALTVGLGYRDDYFIDRLAEALRPHLVPARGDTPAQLKRALRALAWRGSPVAFAGLLGAALEDLGDRAKAASTYSGLRPQPCLCQSVGADGPLPKVTGSLEKDVSSAGQASTVEASAGDGRAWLRRLASRFRDDVVLMQSREGTAFAISVKTPLPEVPTWAVDDAALCVAEERWKCVRDWCTGESLQPSMATTKTVSAELK
eukprot:TRINITY_DN75206_c0_g1_i1.p1 TRINITY_DN75206_c0_g1~~TRINITY_DN75206_c0_g1_i1.p1  ORF type:complete len:768 (-),score=134.80 TRINITY_DN75206_c0_g1_i1:54-2261(-)